MDYRIQLALDSTTFAQRQSVGDDRASGRLLGVMSPELEDHDAEILVHPRLLVRVPASGVIG